MPGTETAPGVRQVLGARQVRLNAGGRCAGGVAWSLHAAAKSTSARPGGQEASLGKRLRGRSR